MNTSLLSELDRGLGTAVTAKVLKQCQFLPVPALVEMLAIAGAVRTLSGSVMILSGLTRLLHCSRLSDASRVYGLS